MSRDIFANTVGLVGKLDLTRRHMHHFGLSITVTKDQFSPRSFSESAADMCRLWSDLGPITSRSDELVVRTPAIVWKKMMKISHLNQTNSAFYLCYDRTLLLFSRPIIDKDTSALIPHDCDPHLNQTKFNRLLPLTIAGVLVNNNRQYSLLIHTSPRYHHILEVSSKKLWDIVFSLERIVWQVKARRLSVTKTKRKRRLRIKTFSWHNEDTSFFFYLYCIYSLNVKYFT